MDDNLMSQNSNSIIQLHTEKKILRISFVGSTIFLLLECLAAFFTHSQAVLMDCVYDLVDLAMLCPFMILVPKLFKPVTEKWPYGYAQMESFFVILKCGLLLFLDIQLMLDSIALIMAGGHHVNAGAIAVFELFISVSCIANYILLTSINRRSDTGETSPTISAELYIWKLDAWSTGGVGAAFLLQLLIQITPFAGFAPYIDPLIATAMALILAKEPFFMICDALKSLLLAAPDRKTVESIRHVADRILTANDFDIAFLNVTKTGRKIWVDVHITKDDDVLSISSLDRITNEMTTELEKEYKDIVVKLIPNISFDYNSLTASR